MARGMSAVFEGGGRGTPLAISRARPPAIGRGLALLRAIDAVEKEEGGLATGDERTGLAILKRALEAPEPKKETAMPPIE